MSYNLNALIQFSPRFSDMNVYWCFCFVLKVSHSLHTGLNIRRQLRGSQGLGLQAYLCLLFFLYLVVMGSESVAEPRSQWKSYCSNTFHIHCETLLVLLCWHIFWEMLLIPFYHFSTHKLVERSYSCWKAGDRWISFGFLFCFSLIWLSLIY